MTQRTGERLRAWQDNGYEDRLIEDRPAPWRTSSALQGRFYKWPETKQIKDAADQRAQEKLLAGVDSID